MCELAAMQKIDLLSRSSVISDFLSLIPVGSKKMYTHLALKLLEYLEGVPYKDAQVFLNNDDSSFYIEQHYLNNLDITLKQTKIPLCMVFNLREHLIIFYPDDLTCFLYPVKGGWSSITTDSAFLRIREKALEIFNRKISNELIDDAVGSIRPRRGVAYRKMAFFIGSDDFDKSKAKELYKAKDIGGGRSMNVDIVIREYDENGLDDLFNFFLMLSTIQKDII